MTLTKERKVYVALLGLGLGALVVDGLLPASGKDSGPADEYTVSRDGQEEAPAAAAMRPETVAETENSIRNRLLAAGERMGVSAGVSGDGFARPASWSPAEAEPSEATSPADEQVSTFEEDYVLSAVMHDTRSGRGFVTLVSPRIPGGRVTVWRGGEVDGHTLVSISARSAVFRGPEGDVRLDLKTPDAGMNARQGPDGGRSDPA